LKEAKAKQEESGTKGKHNNNLENKDRIIKEVNKIISEELLFLNGHHDYDLNRYYHRELIYGSCFLAFFNLEEIKNFSLNQSICLNNYSDDKKDKNLITADTWKILNLIAGFELLGIGINVHGTAENIIKNIYSEKENLIEDIDKNYTLELLFGDIFYSRAVIYLINYDDFFVFEDILNSLLQLHYSRLTMHQKLIKFSDEISDGRIFYKLKENIAEIKNLNALLKSAFLIGLGASDFKLDFNNYAINLRIIDDLVLFKTYSDMENYLKEIPAEIKNSGRDEYLSLIRSKKESLMSRIDKDIYLIKPLWLRNNFSNLAKLF